MKFTLTAVPRRSERRGGDEVPADFSRAATRTGVCIDAALAVAANAGIPGRRSAKITRHENGILSQKPNRGAAGGVADGRSDRVQSRTARTFGLAAPTTLLALADELIE